MSQPLIGTALDLGYALAKPALFRLDAERAHELILSALKVANAAPAAVPVVRRLLGVDDPRLAVEAFGLRFPNPIGLAAGLDKNALALNAWAALGFGHVEVGTVTALPQPGTPRPRVFRLPRDRALINRMGFPSEGAAVVASRLAKYHRTTGMVVGGNVGKGFSTRIEDAAGDYARASAALAPHVDYMAANVSSPNTPGLRTLQGPEQVRDILRAIEGSRPVLLKLAPDLDLGMLPEVVAAAREAGAAGFIATNTTVERGGLAWPDAQYAQETGGLSGVPLSPLALRFLECLASEAGPALPVISAGGIFTRADVQARLAAGARLVQVYTGLVYQGPGLVAQLLR